MDVLILFFVVFGGVIVLIVVLAQLHPGTGADLLDWDPRKREETRYAAEYEDMEDMLETHNRRRRAQGLEDVTEEEYAQSMRRQDRRR